jgi:glutathione peroxidase
MNPPGTADQGTTSLADWDGDLKLIVNVASRCGFTRQYAGLEDLYRRYRSRGLTVLGFPSHDFRQELATTEEITQFCSLTYGVTFPMFDPVHVLGPEQDPLFRALADTPDEAGDAGEVRWNFEKFLVAPTHHTYRFRSAVEPDDPRLVALIESHLPR